MRKTIQDLGILTKFLNCQTVIFLIQEKTGLLSVLHIHMIPYAILTYFNLGIKRSTQESFTSLHAFQFTNLGVASLIDAANPDSVLQKDCTQDVQNFLFVNIDSQCQRLYH